jgi:branched-chain amino acid transport system substrate-binding protein
MARHLSLLGLGSVAVIYDLNNRAYTESWFEDFRAEYEPLGGTVTAVETYTSGPKVHFSDVVSRALSGDAEGLVIIASAMDTAMLCQQVRKKGRTVPVAAAEWAATETLIEMGGAAVEGIIVSQFFDRDSKLPGYVTFQKTYRERFGDEPGFASVNAYDAATVVLEAFEKRQKGETLKDAILRISTFPGIQGPVTINRYGDADRKTFITTVSGGRFRVLE